MRAPEIFIAYTPRGPGLQCALVYVRTPRDVHGWLTGPCCGERFAQYFLLEDFERPTHTRYLAANDPFTGWIQQYSPRVLELEPPERIDEPLGHQLVQLQNEFAHEWLRYRTDPLARAEFERYERSELPAGELVVPFGRLNGLSKLQPTWRFYSAGCEHPVIGYLLRHGPLDYRKSDD